LEGLEISEANVSEIKQNKDVRIDSQFYTQAPKKNPRLPYKKIGELLIGSQYGLSIEMNEDGIGFPIYRMNEIHNMLCDLSVTKYAAITSQEYNKFALRNGDLLFNRTNSFEWVGRTGIYYQNDEEKRTFASYLVKLIPKEDVLLPEYLCTFLNSKYGMRDIKRRARQSINQTNVNPEEVKEIDIPLLPMDFQHSIRNLFIEANSKRVESSNLYFEAEGILNRELCLNTLKVDASSSCVRQLKESFLKTGRLDSEFYLPKYDSIRNLVQTYKNGSIPLSKIAKIYRGSLISDSFYCDDTKCPCYLRGADISTNRLTDDKVTHITNEFVHTNEIICKTGDIVFAMIGSVGTAAFVTGEFSGSYVSNNLGVIRVNDKSVLPEFIHLYLTSEYLGALLFEQMQTRTAQPKISDKDIGEFPIPLLDYETQRAIVDYVRRSTLMRQQAKQLLEEAKLKVETAISGGG
jgi:restriction endonuclease S subunit